MSKSAIDLVGDKALQRELREISGPGARRVMRSAINAGLNPIMQDARANAPGTTIRKMIKKKVTKGRTVDVVGRVFLKDIFYKAPGDYGDKTVTWRGKQMPFIFVAMVQEFGSPKQNIPAQRYMRNARDKKGDEALRITTRKAEQRLEIEWKKKGLNL